MTQDDTAKTSITPMANGPYLVKNLNQLNNQKGAVETKPTIALCRCGQSANKPFCDGTHVKVAFSSDKSEDRLPDRLDSYQGVEITIHDNRSICAHAGYCTDQLASVFRMRQEPWIDPNEASKEEIIAAVNRCPSGAISYTIPGESMPIELQDATVYIAPNGPYVVRGEAEFQNTVMAEGAAEDHWTLCRCGGSKNKPFCDGSHWYNGFSDDRN